MELTVTRWHQIAAERAGACCVPDVGIPIAAILQDHIFWALDNCPEISEFSVGSPFPLWGLADSGLSLIHI